MSIRLVQLARDDDDRHRERGVGRALAEGVGDHQRRFRRTRPELGGTQRQACREPVGELLRDFRRTEDFPQDRRPHDPAKQRSDGVAEDIAQHRDRRAGPRDDVGARGRVIIARGEDQRLHAFRVSQPQRRRHGRAPGVSEHDRRCGVQLQQRPVDQVGLRLGRPDRAARTPAVAISGAVEHDDPVGPGGFVQQPARLEVLDHAAIAVQQNQRRAAPPRRRNAAAPRRSRGTPRAADCAVRRPWPAASSPGRRPPARRPRRLLRSRKDFAPACWSPPAGRRALGRVLRVDRSFNGFSPTAAQLSGPR